MLKQNAAHKATQTIKDTSQKAVSFIVTALKTSNPHTIKDTLHTMNTMRKER
jgi:hypothetical protein